MWGYSPHQGSDPQPLPLHSPTRLQPQSGSRADTADGPSAVTSSLRGGAVAGGGPVCGPQGDPQWGRSTVRTCSLAQHKEMLLSNREFPSEP